jgi:hypothetical protein
MSVMNTQTLAMPEPASEVHRLGGEPHDSTVASARPTVLEVLQEVVPLVFFVPLAGPPAILLVGPLLLLVLLLIPPAALLITLAVVCLLGAALLAALGALLASPYLLVRHLRARHAAHPAPAAPEVAGARVNRPAHPPVGAHLIHLPTR